ncbi:MAG: hypothetical protein E7070_03645 [Bacteroidales bacterium]|jgi:hypothetical protein|nr:hypothetical protein [Bacteroidales bacterium]
MKNILLPILLHLSAQSLFADAIDSLEARLRSCPIQEKIYIHTDNNSYFVGDTIWYKAYVLRADDLRPTDMSKILYVELLTPDGYLVERQRIIIDHNTQSYGQFALPDTMYSGYYEVRAYTRWLLNFNVTERPHSGMDDEWFFNKQLAHDYFRDYEGLYSRVFPIYERPKQTGDYSDKRIVARPKRRLVEAQNGITVKFFPEGGSLVADVKSRVAFEALDADGRPLNISGTLSDGTELQADDDGRGTFFIKPNEAQTIKAEIQHEGKTFSFDLPDVQSRGAVIAYDAIGQKAEIVANGIDVAAVSVTCRGRLVTFNRGVQAIDAKVLPTGVNEIVAYDAGGNPLAVRQIFVNRNDIGQKIALDLSDSLAVKPFEGKNLRPSIGQLQTVSIAVCDRRGDEPTYDDGSIMTDLLLAGELRGFVAHPAQYFEADDDVHRQKLDLLMMIQGWRKYAPLADKPRHEPERGLRIDGRIYKFDDVDLTEFDLIHYAVQHRDGKDGDANNICYRACTDGIYRLLGASEPESADSSIAMEKIWYVEKKPELLNPAVDYLRNLHFNHRESRFTKRTLVEGEVVKGNDAAGIVAECDSMGRFSFNVPPFYDQAMLFMTAYTANDSARKCMASVTDKKKLDPFVCPDFYVRRELFYPKFCQPFAWRQTHCPNATDTLDEAEISPAQGKTADRILQNVTVDKRQERPLHKFDWSKPAFVCDFSQLLNDATDDGLHYAGFNGIVFWEELARHLFGNMNDPLNKIGVRAAVEGHTFLKTYKFKDSEGVGEVMSARELAKRIDPRHIWKVRVFTDYDMRNGIGKDENRSVPDVWFDVIPIPDEGNRAMRRDRRMVIDGIAYPEQFYHRSYADSALPDSADYRRTLYWNPNAHPDKDGNIDIKFFNGARPAHLKVTMCGVGEDGQIYYY